MKKTISLLAFLTLGLVACGQQSTSADSASSPTTRVASLSLEMVGANLKTVDAESLQTQDVKGVRVRNKYKFSNGDHVEYITVGDRVVDGDMIITSKTNFERAIKDYQEKINGKLQEQGAMTNRCTARTWFGGCVGVWQGVSWPKTSDGYFLIHHEPLTLDPYTNNEIRIAMNSIEQASNYKIRFIETTTYYARLYFTNDPNNPGCWSYLGWQQNRQQLNIGNGCEWRGIVVHELLHALGMMHEHQRPERDNYITVNESNLGQTGRDNFWKYWYEDYAYGQNTAYDYGSIMHYPEYTNAPGFAVNPNQPLFTLNQAYNGVVGQRDGMSQLDVTTLNLRYR